MRHNPKVIGTRNEVAFKVARQNTRSGIDASKQSGILRIALVETIDSACGIHLNFFEIIQIRCPIKVQRHRLQGNDSIIAAKAHSGLQQHVVLVSTTCLAGILSQSDIQNLRIAKTEIHHLAFVAVT